MGWFLKNFIARWFINNPIRFRLFLVFAGILAGVSHPWFKTEITAELSNARMMFMLGFSTMTFTFMLTLYRMLQKLFRRGVEVEGQKVDFDERTMVRTAGIFWFIPFGLTLQVSTFSSAASDPYFGRVMIIQGLAIALGAWISQIIKK